MSYTFHGKKRGDSLIERGTSRTPGTEMLSRKMKTSVYMILFIPVVNTADLIEAADHFRWAALTNAAATLARGQDIEVLRLCYSRHSWCHGSQRKAVPRETKHQVYQHREQ